MCLLQPIEFASKYTMLIQCIRLCSEISMFTAAEGTELYLNNDKNI